MSAARPIVRALPSNSHDALAAGGSTTRRRARGAVGRGTVKTIVSVGPPPAGIVRGAGRSAVAVARSAVEVAPVASGDRDRRTGRRPRISARSTVGIGERGRRAAGRRACSAGPGRTRGRHRRARRRASRSCRRTRPGRRDGGGRRTGSARACGRRRPGARPPSRARSGAAAGRAGGVCGTGARTDARRGVRRTARWRPAAAWSVAESSRGSPSCRPREAASHGHPGPSARCGRVPTAQGRWKALRYTLDPVRAVRPSRTRPAHTPGA